MNLGSKGLSIFETPKGLNFLYLLLQLMILQDADGRVASNQSIPWNTNHILMSNLEPRHTYYIKIAAYNGQGIGPFSMLLTVRPEPSLALGAVSVSADGSAGSTSGWVVPLVICFVIAIGILATAALFFVRFRRGQSIWKTGNGREANRLYNLTSQTLASLNRRRKVRKPEVVHSTSTGNFDLATTATTPTNQGEFQLLPTERHGRRSIIITERSAADGASEASGEQHHEVPDQIEPLNFRKPRTRTKQRRKSFRDSFTATMSTVYRKISSGSNTLGRKKHREVRLRRRRSLGTTGTSEDDSDYAYIDRSTHSITGYLQSPTKAKTDQPTLDESTKVFADDNTFSTTSFIDSPSPYATIQVLRKQRAQQGRQHWNRPMHPYPFHTLKVKH